MTIEPKFKINDLVTHKFRRPPHGKKEVFSFYEVIEIQSVTCSAGTQIFYDCRGFYYLNTDKWGTKDETSKLEIYDIGVSLRDDKHLALFKFREDELVQLPKNEFDFVTGAVGDLVP